MIAPGTLVVTRGRLGRVGPNGGRLGVVAREGVVWQPLGLPWRKEGYYCVRYGVAGPCGWRAKGAVRPATTAERAAWEAIE